jgi:hypothetical protein
MDDIVGGGIAGQLDDNNASILRGRIETYILVD